MGVAALCALLGTLVVTTAAEAASPRCPRAAEAEVGLALLALERGVPGAAVRHLDKARKLAPQCPELWRERMHRATAARVAASPPLPPQDRKRLVRAQGLLLARRYAEAEGLLWALHRRHPGHTAVQDGLLVALAETGRLAGMVERVQGPPRPAPTAPSCPGPWALWQAYAQRFVAADGRVIDHTDKARSTSEGQAYGLFHALVAGDRARFDRILAWTNANLAGGKLGQKLPAWHWGRRADGRWGIIDRNPASDADLWMVYALLEASRLWGHPPYRATALAMAERVVATELAQLPGLGPMILPAPKGFVGPKGWTLNPSYTPIQLLDRLASAGVPGPWRDVRRATVALLRAVGGTGFVPDWLLWRRGGGAMPGRGKGQGSYDAIRNYLWAGTLAPAAPDRAAVASALSGLNAWWLEHGWVPERVDAVAGRPVGERRGPVGFLGAILPDISRRGDAAQVARLRRQIAAQRRGELYGSPPTYYDHNLLLFGLGFADGRYRFGANGALLVRWGGRCPSR